MPLIELKNLSKTYDGYSPVHALKDVNLSIEEGDLTSIIGPSGSGKSTLLNILGLLDMPTAGDYIFAEQNVVKLKADQQALLRGKEIGFIFQSFHLIDSKTVLENVMLSGMYCGVKKKQRLEFAKSAIDEVGLNHRKDFYPSHLSGGEKQRVAIARSICLRPKLLLCDEPTGNLDSENTNMIMDLLQTMNSLGLTVLIVTHDDQIASKTDKIIKVKDGLVS